MQSHELDDATAKPLSSTPSELDVPLLAVAWLVFALAYFGLAQLGLLLAVPEFASPIWPAAGLAVAVVLRFGPRLLPGVLFGEAAVALMAGVPPIWALGMGAGNLAATALAVAALRRLGGRPDWLQRSRDVLIFIGAGALAASLVAATVGTLGLRWAGWVEPADLFRTWVTWWLGDAVGMILVGSLFTAWLSPVENAPRRRPEFLLLLAANIGLAGLVFAGWLPGPVHTHPLVFLLLPGLLLVAFRFPQRQLTLALFATAAIATAGTARGFGPLADLVDGDPQMLLQGFLLVLGSITLLVRSVLSEREAAGRALARHRAELEQRVQQATAALRATNEQLEAERNFMSVVQDTAQTLLLVMDRTGRMLVFNRACQELSGYDAAEALGRRPWQLFAAAGEAAAREAKFAAVDTDGPARVYEDEWLTKTGERRRIAWNNAVIRDDADEVLYVVATGLDVTERHLAEAELARLNDHVRLLMESAKEGILGVDEAGRCTFVNPAATGMLGYAAEDLLGRDLHALLQAHREDGSPYPREQSPMLRAMGEGRGFEVEDEVLWTRQGAALPVQYSVNPVHGDAAGGGAVVVFRDITEARALARHLDYLASHDELTGLYNRRYFDRHLQQVLEQARAQGDCHVLCYVDLDQFKLVNDTCGHVAGDELLRQLGRELRSRVRPDDVLARLGGDEFGVLLHSCALAEVEAVIEGLREAICDYRFAWDGRSFALGASIGVVQVSGDTASVTAALSAADAACYAAKDRGRNRIQIYQDSDTELARRRGEMQWVSRLHTAMVDERLYLVGQRITPTQQAGSGLHLEILLRLRDEEDHEVLPGTFIPAAERYNLMPAIDRWVIRETFGWLARRPDLLHELELCAINLSGSSVGDAGMRDYIVEQMRCHGVAARQVCFEITETAAVANLTSAAGFVRELRALGFRFALDDFGNGMSSFAYLKHLPVDYLKIDGNFVKDILVDPSDDAMVQAINQVGHVMGLTTVAEFVESQAILDRLRVIGVDYAQGFGIARPQAVDSFGGGFARPV